MQNKWIGVDLDGTLATYSEWKGNSHIGDPVKTVVDRVKLWIENDIEVKIFTARASSTEAITAIKAWCLKHIGQELQVTNVKDHGMILLLDDRAVSISKNTGRLRDVIGQIDFIMEETK